MTKGPLWRRRLYCKTPPVPHAARRGYRLGQLAQTQVLTLTERITTRVRAVALNHLLNCLLQGARSSDAALPMCAGDAA